MSEKVPDLLLRNLQEVLNEKGRCIISRRNREAA
jgi:hypothetical protein